MSARKRFYEKLDQITSNLRKFGVKVNRCRYPNPSKVVLGAHLFKVSYKKASEWNLGYDLKCAEKQVVSSYPIVLFHAPTITVNNEIVVKPVTLSTEGYSGVYDLKYELLHFGFYFNFGKVHVQQGDMLSFSDEFEGHSPVSKVYLQTLREYEKLYYEETACLYEDGVGGAVIYESPDFSIHDYNFETSGESYVRIRRSDIPEWHDRHVIVLNIQIKIMSEDLVRYTMDRVDTALFYKSVYTSSSSRYYEMRVQNQGDFSYCHSFDISCAGDPYFGDYCLSLSSSRVKVSVSVHYAVTQKCVGTEDIVCSCESYSPRRSCEHYAPNFCVRAFGNMCVSCSRNYFLEDCLEMRDRVNSTNYLNCVNRNQAHERKMGNVGTAFSRVAADNLENFVCELEAKYSVVVARFSPNLIFFGTRLVNLDEQDYLNFTQFFVQLLDPYADTVVVNYPNYYRRFGYPVDSRPVVYKRWQMLIFNRKQVSHLSTSFGWDNSNL